MKGSKPILLRKVLEEAGIPQADLAKQVIDPRRERPVSRALVNMLVNRGQLPVRIPNFKEAVEEAVRKYPKAMTWLEANGHEVGDIWNSLNGKGGKRYTPRDHGERIKKGFGSEALAPGNPEEIETNKEVEMLSHEALKHFKLFRSPFVNDVRNVEDIYLSEDHRYIEAAMLDAAQHGGFLAVVGEVGSGKSVIRKKVVAELNRDENSRVIFPRMIDKTRITASSLCEAIVLDLSNESPKRQHEAKARQVERLLVSRSQAGCHVSLIIEEAHDLSVWVLKLLKRFYEIEDGYKKALGIILIGQPELGQLFNEADNYGMREVIRRCQVAEIRGLNGNVGEYLNFKFERIKVDRKKIIDDKAVKAIGDRLTQKDERKRVISHAYPLTVNNLVIRAMNEAAEMGFPKVTEEVIQSL